MNEIYADRRILFDYIDDNDYIIIDKQGNRYIGQASRKDDGWQIKVNGQYFLIKDDQIDIIISITGGYWSKTKQQKEKEGNWNEEI